MSRHRIRASTARSGGRPSTVPPQLALARPALEGGDGVAGTPRVGHHRVHHAPDRHSHEPIAGPWTAGRPCRSCCGALVAGVDVRCMRHAAATTQQQWVCPTCRQRNPLEADICAGCQFSFTRQLRSRTSIPGARPPQPGPPATRSACANSCIVLGLFVLWRVASAVSIGGTDAAFARGRWIYHARAGARNRQRSRRASRRAGPPRSSSSCLICSTWSRTSAASCCSCRGCSSAIARSTRGGATRSRCSPCYHC